MRALVVGSILIVYVCSVFGYRRIQTIAPILLSKCRQSPDHKFAIIRRGSFVNKATNIPVPVRNFKKTHIFYPLKEMIRSFLSKIYNFLCTVFKILNRNGKINKKETKESITIKATASESVLVDKNPILEPTESDTVVVEYSVVSVESAAVSESQSIIKPTEIKKIDDSTWAMKKLEEIKSRSVSTSTELLNSEGSIHTSTQATTLDEAVVPTAPVVVATTILESVVSEPILELPAVVIVEPTLEVTPDTKKVDVLTTFPAVVSDVVTDPLYMSYEFGPFDSNAVAEEWEIWVGKLFKK